MAATNLLTVLVPAFVAYVVWPMGMKYSALSYSLVCTACFAWAAFCFFQRSGGMRRIQRLMIWATVFTAVFHAVAILYMNHARVYHFVAGLGLYSISLYLFSAAVTASNAHSLELFFSNRPQPKGLIDHGPYRLIRHPFYTSYMLAWVAGMVITNQPLLALTVVLNAAIYFHAARTEEQSFAGSGLSEAYHQYRNRAGMFLPRLAFSSGHLVRVEGPHNPLVHPHRPVVAPADTKHTEPACTS